MRTAPEQASVEEIAKGWMAAHQRWHRVAAPSLLHGSGQGAGNYPMPDDSVVDVAEDRARGKRPVRQISVFAK